ncbi:DNA damage-inducible protein 1 [Polyrhizophydium stewartii]|uniref:DNA damage-inducible protein 1 n=1 Tax=Polyrhizophydium stewartii TaxID=2732419 RepID=A0ABR4N470_9FUNG
MRICLTNELGDFKTVEVSATIELENLAPLIQAELGVPPAAQQLFFNGNLLGNPKSTLASHRIGQDDIILVRARRPPPGAAQASAVAGAPAGLSRAELARQQILADPEILRRLTTQNPALSGALSNPQQFERLFNEMERQRALLEQQQEQAMRDLENADVFDVEAQRRIAEEIRKANVAQNMETAMEYHPESFGRVVMLYINCEVNGHPVKAFVDSGAQATIMSPDCAEKCHVMHLLDERFAGIARGVGTAKILGRIHSTQIKVGKLFLPCSLTVMEGKGVDLLFGLDMLKRHQACIDLEHNVLRINNEEVRFLAEHELPEFAKLEASGDAPSDETRGGPSASGAAPAPAAASGAASAPGAPQPAAAPPTSGPSPSAAAAPPPSAVPQAAAPRHAESAIRGLMDLGVSREQAIAALDACGGNADLAASMLF